MCTCRQKMLVICTAKLQRKLPLGHVCFLANSTIGLLTDTLNIISSLLILFDSNKSKCMISKLAISNRLPYV